jgi:hypothetical protein
LPKFSAGAVSDQIELVDWGLPTDLPTAVQTFPADLSIGGCLPHRPSHTGGRFARKASMPSSASRASMLRVITSLA